MESLSLALDFFKPESQHNITKIKKVFNKLPSGIVKLLPRPSRAKIYRAQWLLVKLGSRAFGMVLLLVYP